MSIIVATKLFSRKGATHITVTIDIYYRYFAFKKKDRDEAEGNFVRIGSKKE